tara:strand:- start:451 stop:705 length:255 start_codon:yes stop_codon:yes gene_type:complete
MTTFICRACQGAGDLYDIPTGKGGPDDDEVTLDCPDCINGMVDDDTKNEQSEYLTDEACEEAAISWAALFYWEEVNDERQRHDR